MVVLIITTLLPLRLADAFAENPEEPYDRSLLSMNNISTGIEHTVAIKSDGSAISVGHNECGQGDLELWDDAVIVRAGPCVTFGIREDGYVMSAGYNTYGPYGDEWKYLKDISLYRYHVVGLCPDGTVVARGDNMYGQCDISSWSDIKAIAAGGWHTVGLREDGTVVATGRNSHGQCDVQSWRNIVAIAAGGVHTLGLTADGRVLAAGENESGQCNTEDWSDIIAICAGFAHSVGIRADGTVAAVGYNDTGACEVAGWRDVVAIAANNENTVGLTKDGDMLSAGSNLYGQNDFSDWEGIKIGSDAPVIDTDTDRVKRTKAPDVSGPWFYFEDIRTLVIHDQSAMKDYTEESALQAPWAFLSGHVDSIIVERGITKTGDRAFLSLAQPYLGGGVKTIYIPRSVTSIGEGTFDFSFDLSDIYYGGSLEEWNNLVRDIKIVNKTLYCLSEDPELYGDDSAA